jgi:NADH dehydrogenase
MILVVGATGSVGGKIARRLLDAGKRVRILVRPGSDYQALVDAGAEPVMADLKDRHSLGAAVAGVDTVVTTANSAKRGGDDNPRTVDLEGNANLIDAAKEAGVGHFIFVSALGAEPNSPIEFLAAKGKTEEHLRHSGMSYTILAPNMYIDVWVGMVVAGPAREGREVEYVGSGERKHSMIVEDDVAAFAAAAVDNPEARNQYLALGGPEPVCWRDCVAVFESALGRPIPQHGVAPGETVPTLPPAPTIQGLVTALDTYDSPIDMRETAERYGVHLHSLDDWVRGLLVGASSGR